MFTLPTQTSFFNAFTSWHGHQHFPLVYTVAHKPSLVTPDPNTCNALDLWACY